MQSIKVGCQSLIWFCTGASKYMLFTFPELQFRMSDMMTGHIH